MFWTTIFIFYFPITLFAIYMTYQEQKRQERPSLVFNLIGYLLCTVWPLLVAAIGVIVWRQPADQKAAEPN